MPQTFRTYSTASSVPTSHEAAGLGGTGLGLTITRAIVEAHGGGIFAASSGSGQGAAATIRRPWHCSGQGPVVGGQ